MENIDVIYYINLAHRTDRKAEFLSEMKKLGVPDSKVQRIDAIYTPEFGPHGCGLSHKKAVETFLESSHKNCIVFEDDFMLTIDTNYANYMLGSIFKDAIQYDVVMLAGNIFNSESTEWHYLKRVFDGQTASAYLFTREFAPHILQNLNESIPLLKDWYINNNRERKHEYCLDIYWKHLQPKHNWYILNPKIGIQRESYSDNENKMTNYGV
jgi:GR25 family glycosyltransferase involved in LPS biosynthesis